MYAIPGMQDDINSPLGKVSGEIRSNSPTAGIGYSTGAGGSVTQLTNLSTDVTLNTVCGEIITASEAVAPDSWRSFTLFNSTIEASDNVVLFNQSGVLYLHLISGPVAAGRCTIGYVNYSGAVTIPANPNKIRFMVLKATLA